MFSWNPPKSCECSQLKYHCKHGRWFRTYFSLDNIFQTWSLVAYMTILWKVPNYLVHKKFYHWWKSLRHGTKYACMYFSIRPGKMWLGLSDSIVEGFFWPSSEENKLADFITADIAKQLTPWMCIDRTANVHSANVGSMSGQCSRRWSIIKTTMGQCLVWVVISLVADYRKWKMTGYYV